MFGKRNAQSSTSSATNIIPFTDVVRTREQDRPCSNHTSSTFSSYAIPAKSAELRPTYVSKVVDVIDPNHQLLSDEDFSQEITSILEDMLRDSKEALSRTEQDALIKAVIDDIVGFGPIEPLLKDPTVTDILINGPDKVFIERNGLVETTDVRFIDSNHLMNIVQRIVNRIGRRVDASSPIVDARLPDGSRICVAIPPASVHFISVSIRKFMTDRLTLIDLVERGAMSPDIAVMLQLMARLGANVLISGGTGSGKTTLLNAMLAYVDPRERIVTIEDTAEVQLNQPNVVTLECRPPNIEGTGQITMADLLKTSLRMRPNRLVLGEVRDSAAGELLQAMNTGHDGSIGTLHANSVRDALMRFENLCCMDPRYTAGINTRTQMASAINIIVQVSRMSDGRRRVVEISEISGLEGDVFITNSLFKFKPQLEDGAGNIIGKWISQTANPRFLESRKHAFLSELEKEMLRRLASSSFVDDDEY